MIFRNMDQPETQDIKLYPAYNQITEEQQKTVDQAFYNVFMSNQTRVGIRIAQGIAYETAKQMCESILKESEVNEKHIGFKNLVHDLEGKGDSKSYAGAIAHDVGVKKYGAKAMKHAAKTHTPLGEDEAELECEKNPMKESVQPGDKVRSTQHGTVGYLHHVTP